MNRPAARLESPKLSKATGCSTAVVLSMLVVPSGV